MIVNDTRRIIGYSTVKIERVSDCTSPGSGVLYILIDDLTSISDLLLFTLSSASKPHFEKRPVIGNCIKFL